MFYCIIISFLMSRQHRWSLFMGSLKQKGKWTFSGSALAVSVTLLQTLIGIFDILPRRSWPGNEPRQTGIDLRYDQQPALSAWSQCQVKERPPSRAMRLWRGRVLKDLLRALEHNECWNINDVSGLSLLSFWQEFRGLAFSFIVKKKKKR